MHHALHTALEPNLKTAWEHRLRRGKRYRVIRPFWDSDGNEHFLGEEWEFLGSTRSPNDDGVCVFVRSALEDSRIRLARSISGPADVCDHFFYYVAPVI